MENRIRDSFHLIWLIAVVLCAALAVFSLLFASCSKGGADDGDGWHDLPAETSAVPAAASGEANIVAVTFTPGPTSTPEPVQTPAEETPVPEPQG